MYIVIDETTYTEISALSFAPSVDLIGSSLPINEFQVDIHTDDTIAMGQYAELHDDTDALWAMYWIIYAERIDASTVRIRAQSDLSVLDHVGCLARYYDNADIEDVLDDLFITNSGSGAAGIVIQMDYDLDSSFDGAKITGFCPQQSSRERLMWVCFVLGAYVRTYFNNIVEILPIDATATLIPIQDTYWKPTVTYKDHVTAVHVKSYSFTEGTPSTTDKYVTDAGGTHYIITETSVVLNNNQAPSDAPDNIITIDGLYLINSSNVSALISRIAQWYFKRMEVDMDVINNGSYIPGDRVTVYTDADNMATGYINSAAFAFGLQAKSTIHLMATDVTASAMLAIDYYYDEIPLGHMEYRFPVGYSYSVTNPYIDMVMNDNRYVFRPASASVTGTMTSAGATATVQCYVALDLFDDVLNVISVDNITETTETVDEETIVIGVIA